MNLPSVLLRRFARIIGLATLSAALAACSAIKLGYNNADDLAYWWLDGYADFNDDQSSRVREQLARLHRWHRNHELPRLTALLANVEQLVPGEITPAQACNLVTQARERIDAIADHAEPAAASVALSLSPEQLTHVANKFTRNNVQFRKDWIRPPPAAVKEKRFDQALERSEMIYGRLDEPQRQVLRAALETSVFDANRILVERERRQKDAMQTLNRIAGQSMPPAEARAAIRGYIERTRHSPDAEYRRLEQALIEESCRAFSALHNSTTAAQRDTAARRLRAYQRDLKELAAQP